MKENTKPSEPKQVLETEKPSGRGDNMLIALEVTLQYSLMLKLHPSVALLDERLIALEKRIGHRSHTHIFDKSEVERLKNEFAAVHIEVHMLSKLSTVDVSDNQCVCIFIHQLTFITVDSHREEYIFILRLMTPVRMLQHGTLLQTC
jgi:hypothetical protein